MKEAKEKEDEDLDIEDIKIYMGLSVEKKPNYLEDINEIFKEAIPQKNKIAREILKQAGW